MKILLLSRSYQSRPVQKQLYKKTKLYQKNPQDCKILFNVLPLGITVSYMQHVR